MRFLKSLVFLSAVLSLQSCGQGNQDSHSEAKAIQTEDGLATLELKESREGFYFEYCSELKNREAKQCKVLNEAEGWQQHSHFQKEDLVQFSEYLRSQRELNTEVIDEKKAKMRYQVLVASAFAGGAVLAGTVSQLMMSFAFGAISSVSIGTAYRESREISAGAKEQEQLDTVLKEIDGENVKVTHETLLKITHALEFAIASFKFNN